MEFLMTGSLDYEFRTTVVAEFHRAEDIAAIGQWFRTIAPENPLKKYFFQVYTHRDSVLTPGLHPPKNEDLQAFLTEITPYVHQAEIRGFV